MNFSKEHLKFAEEYQNNNSKCLNYMMTNYVDIKYGNIWSEEVIKQKKGELKSNSNYYRLVK